MRTCGSPPNQASSSGPRNSAPAARSCKVAWPGRCSARSLPGSGAARSSTAGGSSRTSGPADVPARAPIPGDVPLALPSPHRRRPNRLAIDMAKARRAERHRAWRKRHYPRGHSHVHRERPRETRGGRERDSLSAAARKRTARRPDQPEVGSQYAPRCSTGRQLTSPWALLGSGAGDFGADPGAARVRTIHVEVAVERLYPVR
jgi:hypothetical protein